MQPNHKNEENRRVMVDPDAYLAKEIQLGRFFMHLFVPVYSLINVHRFHSTRNITFTRLKLENDTQTTIKIELIY